MPKVPGARHRLSNVRRGRSVPTLLRRDGELMAKQQEMGFDPKAEEEERKRNDALIAQLQKDLAKLRQDNGGQQK